MKADVNELVLDFKRGQKFSKTFRLTNLMHTMSVAVSLSTTNPALFSFNQAFSIIPAQSSASYAIIMTQPSDQPPLTVPPDVIAVKSSVLPTGKASQEDLRRLFLKPGRNIFKDASITISFVGPQVVEHLISPKTQIREFDLLFSKAVSGCSGSQLTALLKSAVISGNASLVGTLIDHGGDVNFRDSDDQSILSAAIESGQIDALKTLIASGCTIDCSTDQVLHLASAMNRADMMKVLCANYRDLDVNSVDSSGRSAIHIAARGGFVEVIRFCSTKEGDPEIQDMDGCTPLHLAAKEGHLDAVECLVEATVYSKYALNKQGKTAFAIAVENGYSDLYDPLHLGDVLNRATRVDDVNGIRGCLAEGVNVNGRDQNGWTPLHRAAFKGKIESVKVLMEHGAEVDVVDDNGYTPLHCAVEAGHVQVALVLIGHGAKANLKSLKTVAPGNLDRFENDAEFLVSCLEN